MARHPRWSGFRIMTDAEQGVASGSAPLYPCPMSVSERPEI
jgi:hypothetical protein